MTRHCLIDQSHQYVVILPQKLKSEKLKCFHTTQKITHLCQKCLLSWDKVFGSGMKGKWLPSPKWNVSMTPPIPNDTSNGEFLIFILILTIRYWIVENGKIIFFMVLNLVVNLNMILMVHSIILAPWFTKIGYFYYYLFLNRWLIY